MMNGSNINKPPKSQEEIELEAEMQAEREAAAKILRSQNPFLSDEEINEKLAEMGLELEDDDGGKEDDEPATPPTIEPLTPEIEELENRVEQTRKKYITEAGEHRSINRIRNKILSSSVITWAYKSDAVRSKREYDTAREKLQDQLYSNKWDELEGAGMDIVEIRKEMSNFQGDLLIKIVGEERSKISSARAEALSNYKLNALENMFEKTMPIIRSGGQLLQAGLAAYKKTGNYDLKIGGRRFRLIDRRGEKPTNAADLIQQSDAKMADVRAKKIAAKTEKGPQKKQLLKEAKDIEKEAFDLKDQAKGRIIYQYKFGQLVRSTALFTAGGVAMGGGYIGASVLGFFVRTGRAVGFGMGGAYGIATTELLVKRKIEAYEKDKLKAKEDVLNRKFTPLWYEKKIESIERKQRNAVRIGNSVKTLMMAGVGAANLASGSGKISYGFGTINTHMGQNWDRALEGKIRGIIPGQHNPYEPRTAHKQKVKEEETKPEDKKAEEQKNQEEVNKQEEQKSQEEARKQQEEQTKAEEEKAQKAQEEENKKSQQIKTDNKATDNGAKKETTDGTKPEAKKEAAAGTQKNTQTTTTAEATTTKATAGTIPKEAIIDAKHPGYTYTWKAQIEASGSTLDAQKIADSIGYKGDIHKPEFYKALAEKLGYLKDGKGIAVGGKGVASVLKFENGKLSALEYSPEGKLVETHEAGENLDDDFKEKGTEDYEKVYDATPVHEESTGIKPAEGTPAGTETKPSVQTNPNKPTEVPQEEAEIPEKTEPTPPTPPPADDTAHPEHTPEWQEAQREIVDEKVEKGVEAIFGKNRFGVHINGADTRSWEKLRFYDMEELMDKKFWFPPSRANDVKDIKYLALHSGVSYKSLDVESFIQKIEESDIVPETGEVDPDRSVVEDLLDEKRNGL